MPTFEDGDWKAVETFLGVRLPADFKRLIGAGGPICLDDELYLMSPFARPVPFLNLLEHVRAASWAAAHIRASGLWELDYSIYPEPGGLLPWGSDQNGGSYFWDTRDGDPDAWTIVVDGRGVDIGPIHVGVGAYLDGLIDGTIESSSYDADDWPTVGALRRVVASSP